MSAAHHGHPVPVDAIDRASGGIETELGWSLTVLQQGYARVAFGAVQGVPGGPRGYQVLVAVTTEEPSSQLALSHRLGIDKTQMTYLIDALETAGLVERRPDPQDRRVRQVHPTDLGRSSLHGARHKLREAESVLLRDLRPEEQAQLRRLAARVALGAGTLPAAAGRDDAELNYPLAAPERSRRANPRRRDHATTPTKTES